MSPLRHRSLWGRKVRKRLGKAKSEIRPRSRPNSDWGLARAWRGPGAGVARAWCGPSAGLVRAWCGPGAGLARAWCGPGAGLAILLWAQDCFTQSCCGRRIASLNPVVGAGLLHSILSPQQDCPDAAPAALAWSRSCPSTAL